MQSILPYLDQPEGTILDLVVSLGQAGSVKPREVLQAVIQGVETGHRAIRVALLDENQQPIFDGCMDEGITRATAPNVEVFQV